MKPRVGFIGLGKMGKPMALNIVKKGFPLTVFDLAAGPVAELKECGAAGADSPAAVGACSDVVITMLPNARVVRTAVTGAGGLAETMQRGSVLVEMSTSDPATTRSLAQSLASGGVHVLDAPVAKGIPAAEDGTLTIMAGGDPPVFEKCFGVLQAMGKEIFYCGELGAGHVVKIINNLLVGVLVPICAESLALGVKAGVDADTLMQVITSGSGNSFVLDRLIRRHLLRNDYAGVFPVDYMLKDMQLALDLARDHHVPLFFGALAHQLYEGVRNKGKQDDCYVVVAQLVEELAAAEVRTRHL